MTPIEEYYSLLDYLQRNEAPEYLIYTGDALHYFELEFFWNKSVYFHRFSWEQFQDLLAEIKQYDDLSIFGDDSVLKTGLSYYLYSPEKYWKTFIKGIIHPERYGENIELYKNISEHKGYMEFGKANFCDGDNPCVAYTSFQANVIIEDYLKKIIELCDENNISFIMQNPPLNENSYEKLSPQFAKDYKLWLQKLQKEYPNALIDTELYCYDNQYFGDIWHLNRKGTEKFSFAMKRKYAYVFM